ncbi:hypothetical protein [Spiribacter roseus]|uniref:hypothetical protein n=1 Tax=Spiribacter roseus TaxID=1855875 RepID=UPI001330AC8E|nr:hypothetical protein [Spiribacter roseus]KAF0283194.1 hypothetical protein BA898_05025 [Spiribacter roseus]
MPDAGLRWTVRFAGVTLDLVVEGAWLNASLPRLYGRHVQPVPPSPSASQDPPADLSVHALPDAGTPPRNGHDDARRYRLIEPAAGPSHCDRFVEGSVRSLAEIRERVQYRLIDAQHEALLLHGAAIVRNGQAVIFPARSGAGKTTLAAWCVSQGEQVLTDELVAVTPGGGVTGFAQALNIKAHGMPVTESFPGLSPALADAPGAGLGGRFLPLPAAAGAAPLSPGLIVFPQYAPDQPWSAQRLSQGERLAWLLESLMNARNRPRRGLGEANALAAAVPAYRVVYHDLRDLTRWLGARLACPSPTA